MRYYTTGNYIEHLMIRFNIRDYNEMKELIVNHPYVIKIVYNDKQKQKVKIYSFKKAFETFKYACSLSEIIDVKFQYLIVKNNRIKWLSYDSGEIHKIQPRVQGLF